MIRFNDFAIHSFYHKFQCGMDTDVDAVIHGEDDLEKIESNEPVGIC